MAKKATTPAAGETAAAPQGLDEVDRAYAVAVIQKQASLPTDAAADQAEQLGDELLAKLVDAGRNGRVAECRELLGLTN
jgi:hypothetical protein